MTTFEIILAIAGSVGLAEVVRLIVEKILNKKHNTLNDKKDEFNNLKERLEFTEQQYENVQTEQAKMRVQLLQMYNIIIDMIQISCTVDCPNRKLKEVDKKILDELLRYSEQNHD